MNKEFVAFDEKTGIARIRFWTDEVPEGLVYYFNVPIANGAFLSGQSLLDYADTLAPVGQLAYIAQAKAVDATSVKALLTETGKREAEKKNRDTRVSGIKVTTQSGRTFDGDETSQNRMARTIVALNAQPQDPVPTITWVLADNTVAQVTAAELTEALALASAAQTAVWVAA